MTHSNHGPILRFRPRLAPVLLLALATLCGLSSRQSRAQCDLQASNISPLIKVLKNSQLQKTDPDRVRQAILKLGRLRCAAASDDLAALLAFAYRFDWEGTHIRLQPIYTATRYPATGAIMDIGEASLPALVKVIEENPPNSLMSRNATYTVKSIFRDNPSEAERYLKKAAEKATTHQSRSRLKQAVAALPSISLMDFKRYSSPAHH